MIKKGFTLIELLIVVAIIGILAGIVIVSVSGARGRANDAKIKNDVAQLMNAAELTLSEGGTLTDVTIATGLVQSHIDEFKDEAGNKLISKPPLYPGKSANDATDGYAWNTTSNAYEVRGKLKSGTDSGKWFCGKGGTTFVGVATGC